MMSRSVRNNETNGVAMYINYQMNHAGISTSTFDYDFRILSASITTMLMYPNVRTIHENPFQIRLFHSVMK